MDKLSESHKQHLTFLIDNIKTYDSFKKPIFQDKIQEALNRRLDVIIKFYEDALNMTSDDIFNEFCRLSRLVSGAIEVGPLNSNNINDPNNYRFEDPWDYENMVIWEDGIEGKKLIEGGVAEALKFGLKSNKVIIDIKCHKCGEIKSTILENHLLGLGWCSCYKDMYTTGSPKRFCQPQEVIILRLEITNKNKYEYELFNHKKKPGKAFVVCKKCRDVFNRRYIFQPTISNHFRNSGCPKCGYDKVADDKRADWYNVLRPELERTRGHLYNYSEFKYENMVIPNTIICLTCQSLGRECRFKQNMGNHVHKNHGCPRCGTDRTSDARRIDWENDLLPKLIKNKGHLYDYSEFVFKDVSTRGTIICLTCKNFSREYRFEQTMDSHWNGNHGCPSCGIDRMIKSNKSNRDRIIYQFRQVHGDKYDYGKFEYLGNKTKDIIICERCRSLGEPCEFLQDAHYHKKGFGCPVCKQTEGFIQKREFFITEFRQVHGDKYDYSKFEFLGSQIKGIIICERCRSLGGPGEFLQSASDHKRGKGCYRCATRGFDRSRSGILYILEIDTPDGLLYKIGITNRTIDLRYNYNDPCFYKYHIILEEQYDIGEEALEREKMILEQFRNYKYTGDLRLFKITRNSEVLTTNPISNFK